MDYSIYRPDKVELGDLFSQMVRATGNPGRIASFMAPGSLDDSVAFSVDTTLPHWERSCVVEFVRGNRDAFEPLVHFYSPRIYTHIFRLVRSREEAEDLTQETFVLAYRKIAQYDQSRPFRNWLYTIATNVSRNSARARSRRIPLGSDQGDVADVVRVGESAESRESNERLAEAVNQLPDPLPTLIQLHYQEGLTIREAAEIIGMTESAAKVALHRARKTLRERLTKGMK
jgi:RNA polymerase sigma-70 factor (ECF subfamily)